MTELEAAIAKVKLGRETFHDATLVLRAIASGDLITREASDARAGALLREAADACDRTGTCLLPSGHFLSERCVNVVRALSPDATAALQREVKAARGGKPLEWLESHGGFYTDTHAVTERPEGGWVVSVRPIESPVFKAAYEAIMWVMQEVGQ